MNARHASNMAPKFLQMQGFLQTAGYVYSKTLDPG